MGTKSMATTIEARRAARQRQRDDRRDRLVVHWERAMAGVDLAGMAVEFAANETHSHLTIRPATGSEVQHVRVERIAGDRWRITDPFTVDTPVVAEVNEAKLPKALIRILGAQ
jgi:hypothetical protein